jgi:hypothetical protein
VLIEEVDSGRRKLPVRAVVDHDAGVALHDGAGGYVQVSEDLVGTPAADELNGGVIHLPKKECHGTAGP